MKNMNFLKKVRRFARYRLQGLQCRDCVHYHELVGSNLGFCTADENALDKRGRWPRAWTRRRCCPRCVRQQEPLYFDKKGRARRA